MIIGLTRYNMTLQCIDEVNLIPMAYLSLLIDNSPEEKTCHLMGLLRHPEFKGQGCCELLIKKAIDIAKGYGCNLIITGVHDSRIGIQTLLADLGFDIRENKSKNHTKFEMVIDDNINTKKHKHCKECGKAIPLNMSFIDGNGDLIFDVCEECMWRHHRTIDDAVNYMKQCGII